MFTDVVHCTTTKVDCNWQQPPPGRRDHRPIQCVFQHQLTCGIHEKKARSPMGQEQAYTGCPFRAGPDHLSVTGRGSMPTRRRVDPSDARHNMTKAKLDVIRLPLHRPKNQIRDSDLPSGTERVRHIFTGWRTYSTYWRSTATVRKDETRRKKHTEQAQRISDALDRSQDALVSGYTSQTSWTFG